jgi:pyruvate dehydrogenase E2 component (dihydrolipoamide acetyltransferase)
MARSKREIPHYYLGTQVDLTDTLAWLDARNGDRPPAERVLPAVLELKAVALALRDHPDLNGFWVDDAFVPATSIDIGVAIALRTGGLVAPAIHATDTLDLDALMSALRDLVRRCRSSRIRASEATGATLTVTNLGDLGVETVLGVIYPPQVALVGFGRAVPRPWVVDGAVVPRTVVDLTLAADHRQTDGHLGARFLGRVAELLRTPEDL